LTPPIFIVQINPGPPPGEATTTWWDF